LKEIEEVLITALPYVGYPAIATALAAAAEVIEERGLDVDENYAGHRGLLNSAGPFGGSGIRTTVTQRPF
jgi:4-carboxymuconolactone decarboxylase